MSQDMCVCLWRYSYHGLASQLQPCLFTPHVYCDPHQSSDLFLCLRSIVKWANNTSSFVQRRFPPVDLSCSACRSVLTWPGQVLSTSVINPAVCVAACLRDGLSCSAFGNVSAFKKKQGRLCVFICMDFASVVSGLEGREKQKQPSVQLILWFVSSLHPHYISKINRFKEKSRAVFISQTFCPNRY